MNPLGSQSNTHFWPSAEIALLLTLFFGLLALWKPTIGSRAFRKIEQVLSRFAELKKLAVGLMFLSVAVIRLAALAAIAGAHSGDSRRIQLPADGRHVCPWAPRQSNSPDVDELRNFSRELVSDLFLDVPAGAGIRDGYRATFGESVDWCAAERRCHVRGDPLDVASVDACAVGVIGRRVCCPEFGNCQLLDEQLLGRRRCGNWWSACPWGTGAHLATSQRKQCPAARAGYCYPRE